jgi:two-component system sensor histidine kinase/response regulator
VIRRALEVRWLRLENTALHDRERAYIAELEIANRDLESFSSTISHDLRAPLRAIKGYCGMYMSGFAQHIPEEGQRLLQNVMTGTARMDLLIEDLLRFSRFSRQSLQKSRVQLNGIVQRVLNQLQAEPREHVIELRIETLPECDCDPSLIEQVFVNLFSNAFKFTRGRNPAVIEVGSFQSKGETVMFVRDNGAGFNAQYADRLFGVFQRLHSASEFEGTGVGLSIVQRIIQRHGGRIWAESEPQAGATFFFTLPWSHAAAAEA